MFICGLFLTALFIGQHSSAAEHTAAPAPTLTQTTTTTDPRIELLCQAPQGYEGLTFKLYRVQKLVDTAVFSTQQQSARFLLKGNDEEAHFYCCQYQNSMFSSYMKPKRPPKVTVSAPPSPHLVIEPSNGLVLPGQVISFFCQPPSSPQQLPDAFLLLQKARGSPGSMVAPAKLVSRSQQAHFSVRTVGREVSGEYVCLYQLNLPLNGPVNSSASQPVQVVVTVELPVPTLSVSQHQGDYLECVGSPSYPQGLFFLFQAGATSPETRRQASLTQHSARFPLPPPSQHGTRYQCQYSVALGNSRAFSKLSAPVTLPCFTGNDLCISSSPDKNGTTDLAVIIGSVSSGILFLTSISLLAFAMHRHIKSKSQRRRQREEEKFWLHLHARDHVVDLTLKHINVGSQDSGQCIESFSDPIYDYPTSTFAKLP